jgi:phosphoglycolate phosphatase-like HAD superfamily hydrolase
VTNKLKAIAFDFDGVILESAQCKTDAFVELFAPHGPEVQAKVKAHHLENLGISRFVKFAWIYENVLRQPFDETLSKNLGKQFSDLALDKVLAAPFVPGAREAIFALAARYPLFVVSGTPQNELDMIVDRRGLRAAFKEVHGTPREKPEIIKDLLARYSLARSELLFVGDALTDHAAATATGVEFLARNTPEFHDLWTERAVKRVPDLVELPTHVEAW